MSAHEFHSPDNAAHLPPGYRRTPPAIVERAALPHPRADARLLLCLQRTAGNAAVAGVLAGSASAWSGANALAGVQRVTDDEESEGEQEPGEEESEQESDEEPEQEARASMSIGERKKLEREMQNTHSPRLLERLKGSGVGPTRGQRGSADQQQKPYYREPKEKGIWNGKTRPSYYLKTWEAILGGLNQRTVGSKTEWQCPECERWVPKWNIRKPKVNGITIDHHMSFEKWIRATADARDDGKIPNKAAQDAYNDLKNLVGMCRNCNSEKNGEKNLFD